MRIKLRPLDEQVMVITGGSSGIGLATARLAHERGARLVLAARNEEALRVIQAELGGPERCEIVAVDVADADAADRIAAVALGAFGRVDSWVNNAAVSIFSFLEDMDMAEHRRIFDVGYFGLVAGSLKAAQLMRPGHDGFGGAIINIGSVVSDRASPIQSAYSAMKHAVKGFTDALRVELMMQKAPVSVTLIKPGPIKTPYSEHARSHMGQAGALPPPVYDPRVAGDAICHAATHPVRDLLVGNPLLSWAALTPRLTDWLFSTQMAKRVQLTEELPPPHRIDNMFVARSDGTEQGAQNQDARETSLVLEAQKHPLLAWAGTGLVAGAAALLAWRLNRR